MELHAWSLSLKTNEAPLSVHNLSRFFQQAQKLVNGEAGARQQVIRELATEGGLQRVRQAVEQNYPYGPVQKSAAFREQIVPLFNILTNSEVDKSALLEQPVSEIYGYLYGIEGQRLTKLFTWILEVLKESLFDTQSIDEYLTTTLQVLAKMVDRKTDAQVNQNLPPIVNTLNELIKSRAEKGKTSSSEGMLRRRRVSL